MRKIILNKKIRAAVLSFAVLAIPVVSMAQVGIPCEGTAADPCEFNDLVVLANNIIKFLMFTVAVPLAALGFMWAGASLVLNQNKEGAWSEAKERFTDIAKGFGIMLGAYVLIKGVIYSFLTAEQITFMQFMFQ
ncbi:MAG: hypothetical protein WBC83_02700 [Minisyncoccia bacterium]